MAFRHMLVLPILLFFVALSACSGGPPESVEVQVEANEFSFESSITEFEVGVPYRFVVASIGQLEHEFMIMPPSSEDATTMDMEELDEMALAMIPEDELPAGATKTVEYTFTEAAPAGELEFACHVPGHYEAGMKLPIVVR